MTENVEGLMLLLHALAAEGRDVMVIPRSQWPTVDLTGVDYIVVEDETYEAWMRHNP